MKKQKIVFSPVTEYEEVVGKAPVPSVSLIPDWYKNLNQYMYPSKKLRVREGRANGTVKRCSPFLDAITSGYLITTNEDVIVDFENGVPHINWRTDNDAVSIHNFEQTDGIQIPDEYDKQIFKWNNWQHIELPKGYSLLVTHPLNNFTLPFWTMSGIVDCDTYGQAIQFPFLLKKNFEGIIKKGTPVAQLIPFKREDWYSETKPYDKKDRMKKHHKYFSVLDRPYKTLHWIKKIYQ